mgnify:CR=1 FL=1
MTTNSFADAWHRRFGLLLALTGALAAALLLASCGGSGKEVKVEVGDSGDEVTGDMFLRVQKDSVTAGRVTIVGINMGMFEHEIVVLYTDLAAGSLVLDAGGQTVDEGASGVILGEIEPDDLGFGKEVSATFELPAGNYVLFCNVPGHYLNGSYAALKVK